MISVNLQKIKR